MCSLLTDVSSGSVPQLGSAASDFSLPHKLNSSSISYVRDTNVTTSTIEEACPDDHTVKLEMMSSEYETSQLVTDYSVAGCNRISSQAVFDNAVDDSRLLTAGRDSREEAEVSENTGWKIAANVSPAVHKDQDRCISCNKLLPLQQCPVCHSMYPSVAVHIGIHSIRKLQRLSPSVLDIGTTDEDVIAKILVQQNQISTKLV